MWIDEYELAPPPRRVSLMVQSAVLFGGTAATIGQAFMAFSLIFVWIFLLNADLTGWLVFWSPAHADAVIQSVEGTSASVNDRAVMHYTYTFQAPDGRTLTGESYSTSHHEQGAKVEAEYVPGDPETSRLTGMRRATFGPEVSFILLFPLVGGLMALGGLRRGARGVGLLRKGQLTYGTLTAKEPTNVRINDQPVYKFTFTYVVDDTEHQVHARSHTPEALEDEERERVLYDPLRPEHAVLWDELPGSGRVDEMGGLVSDGAGGLKSLILPAINFSGYGLFLLVCLGA